MGTFKNPDVWKQNLAYQIGDFVLYDGTVYMAIKPVPAGTTMQSEYWTAFDSSAVVPNIDIEITENGIYNAEMWKSATVNVEGGGGSTTVEVRIVETTGEQTLTTPYFTAKNSAEESITPTLHEGDNFNYFSIEVDAGNFITLRLIDDSGYSLNLDGTAYLLGEQEDALNIEAPVKVSAESVKFIAVNDTSYPFAYVVLLLQTIE